jgi:hypothetical protein
MPESAAGHAVTTGLGIASCVPSSGAVVRPAFASHAPVCGVAGDGGDAAPVATDFVALELCPIGAAGDMPSPFTAVDHAAIGRFRRP